MFKGINRKQEKTRIVRDYRFHFIFHLPTKLIYNPRFTLWQIAGPNLAPPPFCFPWPVVDINSWQVNYLMIYLLLLWPRILPARELEIGSDVCVDGQTSRRPCNAHSLLYWSVETTLSTGYLRQFFPLPRCPSSARWCIKLNHRVLNCTLYEESISFISVFVYVLRK